MGDIKMGSIIVGFLVFVSIVVGSSLFITSNLTNYDLPNSTVKLSDLDSDIQTLQDEMTVLNKDLEENFQESEASDAASSSFLNVGAVGKVLEKIKTFSTLMLKGINILRRILTSFLPPFVWWLIGSIIFFIIMWKSLEAWLGREA